MADHLAALNAEQLAAVQCLDGPLLVLAGAGTGKTRVVTCRIAEIAARGTPPSRVCALTFTNKAAAEMKARVKALLRGRDDLPSVSTFHSLGARILREFGSRIGVPPAFTIADSADQVEIVADAVRDLGLLNVMRASAAHGRISRWKCDGLAPKAALRAAVDVFEENVAHVYERYEEELRRRDLLDFDDLILRTLELLRAGPEVPATLHERFTHVLVDEYQDTNDAQYQLMGLLAGPRRNVCVVGDDDQSIYAWRGADPARILRFQKDFKGARVVALTRNYRSTQVILDAANRVIANNATRNKKDLRATVRGSRPITLFLAPDEREEMHFVGGGVESLIGQGVRPEQIAVLFRTNRQCRPLELAMRARGIRYRVLGTFSFFDRREVRDLLAYGRLAANPRDDSAFLRIVNLPPRGLGAAALDLVRGRSAHLRNSLRAAAEALLAGPAGSIPERARSGLDDLIGALRELKAGCEESVAKAFEALVARLRYRDHVAKDQQDPNELAIRLGCIDDVIAMARDFDGRARGRGIEAFLQELALQEQDDQEEDDTRGAVSLLTIHAAKGLEFEHVYLPGLEEGVLPHKNAIADEDEDDASTPGLGVEEERRLFYVAITRARLGLSMSYAMSRPKWGQDVATKPSRFLDELGREGVLVQDGTSREPASADFKKRAFADLMARFPPRADAAKEAR